MCEGRDEGAVPAGQLLHADSLHDSVHPCELSVSVVRTPQACAPTGQAHAWLPPALPRLFSVWWGDQAGDERFFWDSGLGPHSAT